MKVNSPHDARERLRFHVLARGSRVVQQMNVINVVDQLDPFYLWSPGELLLVQVLLQVFRDDSNMARVGVDNRGKYVPAHALFDSVLCLDSG